MDVKNVLVLVKTASCEFVSGPAMVSTVWVPVFAETTSEPEDGMVLVLAARSRNTVRPPDVPF